MGEEELAYYRAVEDHFAALRGTPFLFSPKDFSLLRQWWREGVPLAAVLAGISEVAVRRQEREGDPVSSLAYCRHAVVRHGRRLVTSAVGAGSCGPSLDTQVAVAHNAASAREVARRWKDVPAAARVLDELARAVEALPSDAPAAVLDETMAELERAALLAIEPLLPAEIRREVTSGQIDGEGMTARAKERTQRALKLKRLRDAVGLPRLEIGTN